MNGLGANSCSSAYDIPFEHLKNAAAAAEACASDNTSASDDDVSEFEEHSGNLPQPVGYHQAHVCKNNRKRPLEASSRAPVAAPHSLLAACLQRKHKDHARDPRFSELSGKLNMDLFSKSYRFLDDLQKQEAKQLMETLRKPKRPLPNSKKEVLKRRLDQMKSIEHHRKRLAQEQALKRQIMKEEKEKVATTGKMPYIPKRSDIKRILRERTFDELKKSGKLEKHLVRKRKKQAAKDRTFVPSRRRTEETDE